jgi:3-methyladenine DNA glycosylase AlkD
MVEAYIHELTHVFKENQDSTIAAGQKAYMKDNFEFYGIKTELRRELQKPFLAKEYLPSKSDATEIIKLLWAQPQRDFQMFGQELMFKYVKKLEEGDIELIEFMISNKSWWDSVDFIAVKLVGAYFKKFPQNRHKIIERWLKSSNMWLKRSAILFQLKYKGDVDLDFLQIVIKANLGSKEFFINKAIGWVLREYSRTHQDWVENFVELHENELSNLSKREALRLLK